ncbi:MAG: hypothetical protein ACRD1L_11660, partial [Terriglobales bacterium]
MQLKLKTKLTLSISLLVLLVVLAVNLVYLAEVVRQQMQEVYDHADIISNIIFNEMRNEFAAAHLTGSAADPAGLQRFFQGLKASPELATLLSSAIGYGSAIRDVALVAPDGSVVVDSNPLLEGQAQPQRRLMSEVLRGGLWGQLKAIFGREQIYAVSLATRVNQQPLATITIGVDTVLLRQGVVGRVQQAALYGALILLLATGLAWGLAELALAPLGAIIAQLDRLTAANWKRPERQRAPLALDRSAPPERSTGTTQARSGEPPGRSPEPESAGRDEFGVVSSKIQHLGREMEDARQVYT